MKSSGSRRTRSSRKRMAISVASVFAGIVVAGGGETLSLAVDDDNRRQPFARTAAATTSKAIGSLI